MHGGLRVVALPRFPAGSFTPCLSQLAVLIISIFCAILLEMRAFHLFICATIVAIVAGYRLLPFRGASSRPKYIFHVKQSAASLGSLQASTLPELMIEQGCKPDDSNVDLVKEGLSYVAVAKKDLQKGDLLLALPVGLALDTTKLHSKVKLLVTTLPSLKTKDLGVLALNLLAERADGSASKRFAYINQLPRRSPGVLEWSEEEKQLYSQSTTYDCRKYFQLVYHDIAILESLDGSILSEFIKDKTADMTIPSLFRWAVGTIKSRAVLVNGQYVLLPGVDSIAADMWGEGEVTLGGAGIFGGKARKN